MQNSPSQVVELGNLWKKKHAVKHGNWVKPSVKLDHSVKSGHNRTARATPNSFILGETRSNAVDRGDGKIDSHMSITTTNPPPPELRAEATTTTPATTTLAPNNSDAPGGSRKIDKTRCSRDRPIKAVSYDDLTVRSSTSGRGIKRAKGIKSIEAPLFDPSAVALIVASVAGVEGEQGAFTIDSLPSSGLPYRKLAAISR